MAITKDEVVALIGRQLSANEDRNFEILSEITAEQLDITLNGGFSKFEEKPSGLKLLFARLFKLISAENSAENIASKEVEGFKVSYKENLGTVADFATKNAGLIAKYKIVDSSRSIRHGGTIYDHF